MTQSLDQCIHEYRKQLEVGLIQKAYKGLMKYMMALRAHFINKYPDGFVTGNVYQGYMDITYFPFTSELLKLKKLKVAIVFTTKKALLHKSNIR